MPNKQSLVIELLEHLAICGASLMIHALFTPYGHGLRRSIREAEKLAEKCPHDFSIHSQETISVTLSRLKRRGLVARRGPSKKTVWQITAAGKHHFMSTKKKGGDFVLPPKDGRARLVIFDIPENEREKRDWLRIRLLSCGYTPLQKSVWIGERPLPEELRKELKSMGIDSYVHVVGLERKLAQARTGSHF